MFCKTHYDLHGRHRDSVEWIEPIYDWYDIETIEQAIERCADADVIMFSSYIWNYSINDQAACWIKQHWQHQQHHWHCQFADGCSHRNHTDGCHQRIGPQG
jgi:hypothetical protein